MDKGGKMKKIIILLTLLLSVIGCGGKKETEKKEPVTLTVSAAASLKKSLDEIVENYRKIHPDITINVNYGGSGALEKQILGGAEADIFISAAKKNMDNLEKENLIIKETRKDLLKNTLVLIAPNTQKDTLRSSEGLKDIGKIALGEENTVPAGKYGKQVLEKLNLWNDIQNKVVYQKDVTAVLNIVELGEVDAGIVYLTDAKKLKNGFIVEEFSQDLHDPIIYPAAIISSTKNKEQAEQFLKYLENPVSKEIFESNGFKF